MTMLMAQCQREFSMLKSDALRAQSNLRRIKHLLGRHFRPYYLEVTKYTCKKKKRNATQPRVTKTTASKERERKQKNNFVCSRVHLKN